MKRSKNDSEPIDATQFLNSTYKHISAILLGSVTPFLTPSYSKPSFEFLHNPNAIHKLPKGWLKLGNEYCLEDGGLRCKVH